MPQTAKTTTSAPRKRKPAQYRRFKFSKRIKHPVKLSSGWKLFKQSWVPLKQNWRLFTGVLAIYAVLSFVLVQGLSSGYNLSELKASLEGTSQLGNSLTLFNFMLGTSTAADQQASVYQSILLVLVSLTVIWSLRHVQSDESPKKVRVKEAFYNSTQQLIPFLLVVLVIGLKFIPLLLSGTIYSLVVNNGLAVGPVEQVAWAAGFFLLALWSLYMVTSTVIALFIVTLPRMTPMRALRSARKLVQHRRWTVLRKLLFLPLIILIILAIITLPLIIWVTPVAQWVFMLLSLLCVPVVLSYVYSLYRELL